MYGCKSKKSHSWDEGAPFLGESLFIPIKMGISEGEKSHIQFLQVAFAERSNSKWQLPGGYLRGVESDLGLMCFSGEFWTPGFQQSPHGLLWHQDLWLLSKGGNTQARV